MIYCLGLALELHGIQQNLDEEFAFRHVDDISSVNLSDAQLFLIGPSVENPVKYVQQVVAKDQLLSIIILTGTTRYIQIKQSLLFSMSVGKSVLCVVFNPAANYTSVFQNGIVRTQQKRSFSKFNLASERKLSELTSPAVKLDNLGHILEHAPIGAILINKELNVIGANKSSREMFSQLNGSLLPLESLFPRDFIEIGKRIKIGNIEKSLTVEDGRGSYFEITSSTIPDRDVDSIILLINDITERREKNRRINAILESLPNIAWTADGEGNVNYYNQGWHNYTNKEPLAGMGERWVSIVHPDDRNLLASQWKESVKEGKTFQHASRFRRFDGEYRWHLSKATPLFDKNRSVEMWVGTSTDIHDQVLLNEELERKVKERTKLLEETNAELEQFAHISSHDLQEPLRKIQTFAHIVKDDGSHLLSENHKRYIDKIISTSSRMSKLLKDLLSFTKINQQEPESVVNLNNIIHQIKEDLELALVQSGTSLFSVDLPTIKGRPLQIKQLFYNLINNSIKYRKTDQAPTISISCSKLDTKKRKTYENLEDTNHWEIIIKDNGIGFDQRYADQIFTVFQRLHARTSYEGTGIGLAIARKVVTNHCGEIFAISSPGNGAEFHLILPAICE
jgi:PAS domain S-box-containing protein